MNKIYYKCLASNHSSLVVYNPEMRVYYKQGEWVFPKLEGTKLMVFDSLINAKKSALSPIYIYECEVINPRKIGFFIRGIWNSSVMSPEVLIRLKMKKNKKKYIYEDDRKHIPIGTIFCDAVKLTKLIERNDQYYA